MITIKIKIKENEEKGTAEVTLVGVPKKDFDKGSKAEQTTTNVVYSEIHNMLQELQKKN